jgi:hypothetical protein
MTPDMETQVFHAAMERLKVRCVTVYPQKYDIDPEQALALLSILNGFSRMPVDLLKYQIIQTSRFFTNSVSLCMEHGCPEETNHKLLTEFVHDLCTYPEMVYEDAKELGEVI